MVGTADSRRALARVIGIGNEFRRDDSVGLLVARQLKSEVSDTVDVLEFGGDGATLIELWKGVDRVFVVDAVRSGAPPGRIHRIDAVAKAVQIEFFSYSTHAFALAEAVELARRLEALPNQLLIYGIEGADFSTGKGLSEPVRESAGIVLTELRAALSGL